MENMYEHLQRDQNLWEEHGSFDTFNLSNDICFKLLTSEQSVQTRRTKVIKKTHRND